jgi:hypothetical protein
MSSPWDRKHDQLGGCGLIVLAVAGIVLLIRWLFGF